VLAQMRRSRWFPYRAALIVWAFASLFTYLRLGESDNRVALALLVNLPVPLLIFGLFQWLPPIVWRAHFKTHFGPGPYAAAVEIGDTQMIDRLGDFEARYAWHAVTKLEDRADSLCVFLGRFALTQIPKRLFDSEDEQRRWREALEQKTGLSFS